MGNIGYLIELKGTYNLELLAASVKYVVKINKGLQIRFKYRDENKSDLLQYLPDYEEAPVEIIETTNEKELFDKIEEIHRRQFDVTGDNYLCSFVVFSINKKRFGLFEKAHHTVADGISAVVVAHEVIAAYHKMTANEPLPSQKDYSYFDFLADEKEYLDSEKYIKDKEFWLQTYADFQGEDISFQVNKNKKNSLQVKRGNFLFPGHLIAPIEQYKSNNRLSNFPLFMAALAIYFNRFFSHEDMVIGMPVGNRTKKIFRDLAGMFVSTIPLRIEFTENQCFNELVLELKRVLWEALKHQGYPYNHLVKDFKDAGLNPDGFLNVQLIELPGGSEAQIVKRAFFSTQYNISQLSIYLNQQNSTSLVELEAAIDYHCDIFEPGDIAAFFKRLTVILAQAVGEPAKPIAELSLLEEAEYNEIIYRLNDTAADFPADKTLAQLFEEQVMKNGDEIALEYEGETVTYRKLNDLAGKLALTLQAAGVIPDAVVGMLCDRSIEAIICILGVLKAGGAYLPIDPAYPLERKNYILQNSELHVLLIEKPLLERENDLLKNSRSRGVIDFTIDYRTLDGEPATGDFKPPAVSSENLAYVIYTSGTTGNPKGTLLRHRNVVNYICWGAGFYVRGDKVAFPLYTSLSFDLTVTSIFIPLVTGNKIVIYRESKDGLLVERVAGENKVDIMKLTPSHLKIIKELKRKGLRIRSFIVGGEELRTDTAREIDELFAGNIDIYNEYGPTETAVGCMIHRYDKERDKAAGVPIGKPSHNVQIYILDKKRRPMPVGIIGEIYIAGAGVSRGYLKNKELTDEKFIDNPFKPGEKMYKSGDLGRWNLERILEFFGRSDKQVKIRGFRIEPGEIEKQLKEIAGIKEAVVVVVEKAGQESLCAYFVPDETAAAGKPAAIDCKEIRKKLGENLPDYMIPAFYVPLEKIPLTNNGKLDRKALPEPLVVSGKEAAGAPDSGLEKIIGKIWSDVLGAAEIGMNDNFYELGGDSIKAVQIASRCNDQDLSVGARDILDNQTIERLLQNVDFYKQRKVYNQEIITGSLNPTPIAAWFFENYAANPHHFNQSVLLEFARDIDPEIMVKCFNLLVRHHDALRINADLQNKTLSYNNRRLESDVKIEVCAVPDDDKEQDRTANRRADFIKEIGEKVKSSFNIQDSLLIKPVIIKGSGKQALLITVHHLAIDGVSWRILLEDLYNIYRSLTHGEQAKLPAKTASLIDWRKSLQAYSEKEELNRELTYWEKIVNTDFSLPADQVGALPAGGIGTMADRQGIRFSMDPKQTDILIDRSRHNFKSDIEVLLITALAIALYEYTGRKEPVIELENHGRLLEDVDVQRTIGWFTAMYPMAIKLDKEDLVGRIKSVKEQLAKVPHKGIGYGILRYISNKLTGVYNSRVRFNYLGQFDREISNDIFSYSDLDTGQDIGAQNALTTLIEIDCMIMKGSLVFDLYYSKKVFSPGKIDALLGKIKEVLQEMTVKLAQDDEIHFTPSDFETVDLDEEDLENLFA